MHQFEQLMFKCLTSVFMRFANHYILHSTPTFVCCKTTKKKNFEVFECFLVLELAFLKNVELGLLWIDRSIWICILLLFSLLSFSLVHKLSLFGKMPWLTNICTAAPVTTSVTLDNNARVLIQRFYYALLWCLPCLSWFVDKQGHRSGTSLGNGHGSGFSDATVGSCYHKGTSSHRHLQVLLRKPLRRW